MERLSIITINCNNETGLQKTINSVFSQTFIDFEYIIIDGGSTDGSKDLIQQHADKLAYWVSEKDKGIYHAMNKGIKASKGDYLLFLNSGDWFYNNDVLQSTEKYLEAHDIIYGDIMYIKKDGKKWLYSSASEPSLYFLGYCWNSLPHQAMFIKKQLFDMHGGYDESLKMVSDWAFYLVALFKYNCSYKKISNVIAYYDFEGFSSNVSNEVLQRAERELVIDKYFKNHVGLFKEFARLKSTVWCYEHSGLIKAFQKIGFLRF